MKFSTIVLSACVFTLSPLQNAFSKEADCESIKSDVKLYCSSLSVQCESVNDCLVRRDTCLPNGKPKNEADCQELSACAKELEPELSKIERCDYYWADTSGAPFCMTKSHFLYRKEGCPGRFGGFFKTVAYGYDSALDDDFKCEGTKNTYKSYQKLCSDAIADFAKKSCGKGAEDKKFIDSHKPVKCEVVEKFDTFKKGQFANKEINSNKVNQSARGSNTKSSAGKNQNAQPAKSSSGVKR